MPGNRARPVREGAVGKGPAPLGTSSAAYFTREAARGNPPVATPAGRPEPTSHLPPVQTDPRLDLPEDPHPRGSRPVDLADPRRLHPTATRPPAGSRPASALGETNLAGQAHPRPSPPRLSTHPPTSRLSDPNTETLPPRPRAATGPKEHPTHTAPRRAHTPQNTIGEPANEEVNHPTTPPHGLKIKLVGTAAFHRREVHDPQVVAPQCGIAGQCAGDSADEVGGVADCLLYPLCWGR